MPDDDRRVLCVRRSACAELAPWQLDDGAILSRILDAGAWSWQPKAATEDHPDYRQVIPVLVVREAVSGRVLACRRLAKATEGRLAGRFTLSLGGHCEQSDGAFGSGPFPALIRCLAREYAEELAEAPPLETLAACPVGLIASDASEVDRAHLGWVWLGTVPDGTAVTPGPEFSEAWWAEPGAIRRAAGTGQLALESWGRLLLDGWLDPIGVAASA